MESNLVLIHHLEEGTHATPIDVVYESSSMEAYPDSISPTVVSAVAQVKSSLHDTKCQKKLWCHLSVSQQKVNSVVTPEQKFLVTLEKNHEAFTLEEEEKQNKKQAWSRWRFTLETLYLRSSYMYLVNYHLQFMRRSPIC